MEEERIAALRAAWADVHSTDVAVLLDVLRMLVDALVGIELPKDLTLCAQNAIKVTAQLLATAPLLSMVQKMRTAEARREALDVRTKMRVLGEQVESSLRALITNLEAMSAYAADQREAAAHRRAAETLLPGQDLFE